ncbi:MAG: NAD(P)-dependent oxidoreductase [Propionibacteriaceae bacterium]|jgi:3-hydroxyisobutyrate dehydrogenase|nr:NAD(P)-dependent oxidoreductase [Propionibacteriaceae bacterium]
MFADRVTRDRDERLVPELRRAALGLSAEPDQHTPQEKKESMMTEMTKIAFLGLGRMGRELVNHLVERADVDLVVWNRSAGPTESYRHRGIQVADSPAQAWADADIVMTCLFGPDAVREVILEANTSLPESTTWVDISTVGPIFAEECAQWSRAHHVAYVHSPVLGSLGPARAGGLGVLIGGDDADARTKTRQFVSLWADADRIVEYDCAVKAASGKLIINYGLAVGMQAIIEATRIGQSGGMTQAEAIDLLKMPKTPLSVIAAMKADLIATRDYSDTQFSTNLLAKDSDLMLTVAQDQPLPALVTAFAALEHARRAGHGEDDFASMAG